MYTISKEFAFEASHQLIGMPEGHQCARLHGHSYRVVMVLEGEALNELGFVRDYGDLKIVKDYLDDTHDHRHLNDIYGQPTAEVIAYALFQTFCRLLPELVAVRVSETAKTWAEYRP